MPQRPENNLSLFLEIVQTKQREKIYDEIRQDSTHLILSYETDYEIFDKINCEATVYRICCIKYDFFLIKSGYRGELKQLSPPCILLRETKERMAFILNFLNQNEGHNHQQARHEYQFTTKMSQ